MENYKIGIKLADGSFYPILEEGRPQVKTIELTTVRDDQTTVQLDLYRSLSDNMEDAEYVDTLLVENLLPRPKELPTLNLKIEIDSENVLSASIEDCESGEHSETKVSLVTLDSSERTIVPDFSMIDAESADNEESDSLLDEFADNTIAIQEEAVSEELSDNENLNLDDFGDVDELISDDEVLAQEVEQEDLVDELPEISQDLEELSEEPILDDEQILTAEPTFDGFGKNTPAVELASEDLYNQEIIENNAEIENSFIENEVTSSPIDEIPALDDMPTFEEGSEIESSDDLADIPDLDEMPAFEDTQETETSDGIDQMPDLDLSPMDDMDVSDENDIMKDSILEDDFSMPENDFNTDESELSEEAFPDFSDIPTTQADNDESDFDKDDGFFGIGNDYGDLGDDMDIDDDMLESDAFASNIDTSGDLDDSIPSPDLSFSDLYVDSVAEDSSDNKRCKIPVLICSLCAIICVIALLLILFLTPSKLKGKDENSGNSIWQEETVVEEVIPVPVPTESVIEKAEPDVIVEEEAKEDEIVIVEAPVVTPKEPEVVPEKLKGVEYKIKWGDTLWDIAGTYYKNPWLYKFIADYNNLENPDYIISGTIITIPPR